MSRYQVEIDNYLGNLTKPQIKLLLKIIGPEHMLVENETPDAGYVAIDDMIIGHDFVEYLKTRYSTYNPTATEIYDQFKAMYPDLAQKITMSKVIRLLRNLQVISKSFSVREGNKVNKRVKVQA